MRRILDFVICALIVIAFFALAGEKMLHDAASAERDNYLSHLQLSPAPANYESDFTRQNRNCGPRVSLTRARRGCQSLGGIVDSLSPGRWGAYGAALGVIGSILQALQYLMPLLQRESLLFSRLHR